MKTKGNLQARVIGTLVAMALLLQPAASAFGQQAPGRPPNAEAPLYPAPQPLNELADPAQLPDSPGAVVSRGAQQQSDGQQAPLQPLQQPQQNTEHEPVGTAAAEWVPATGIAASRPAGAALAPAKQRRARSILIKVGALLGAGVALGTVMALSEASPSKPPGSR
jgi:hypothetical protein